MIDSLQNAALPGDQPASAEPRQKVDAAILEAVRSVRYGSVEIIIHDSRVVQIDCTRKMRMQLERIDF